MKSIAIVGVGLAGAVALSLGFGCAVSKGEDSESTSAEAVLEAGCSELPAADAGDAGDAGDADPADAAAPCVPGDAAADGGAVPKVLLNEIAIEPAGDAGVAGQFVELFCTPNAPLAGFWFAGLEGDLATGNGASSPGTADVVIDLGAQKCGKNGIVLIKAKTGGHASLSPDATVIATEAFDTGKALEKGSASFVVIRSATPLVAGQDYDANDDGTIELPAGATVVDGISLYDQGDGGTDQTYAPRLSSAHGAPHAATRSFNDFAPSKEAAWYGGALTAASNGLAYDASKTTARFLQGAVLTPGAPNYKPVSAPSSSSSSGGTAAAASDGGAGVEAAPAGGSGGSTTPTNATDPKAGGPTSAESVCSASPGSHPWSAGFVAIVLGALALARTRRRHRP